MNQFGIKIVWGTPAEIKPVTLEQSVFSDLRSASMRLRFRSGQPGRAYFRTADGIRCFILEDIGGFWSIKVGLELGRNVHFPPTNHSGAGQKVAP